jgi:hypothetical protein
MNPANASPNANANVNQQFTQGQIVDFINQQAGNTIDYAIQRNPTVVYKFIQQNYPGLFTNLAKGAEVTLPFMESMSTFLKKQHDNLPADQQAHWLLVLLASLPDKAQLDNWTTPGTPRQTTIIS